MPSMITIQPSQAYKPSKGIVYCLQSFEKPSCHYPSSIVLQKTFLSLPIIYSPSKSLLVITHRLQSLGKPFCRYPSSIVPWKAFLSLPIVYSPLENLVIVAYHLQPLQTSLIVAYPFQQSHVICRLQLPSTFSSYCHILVATFLWQQITSYPHRLKIFHTFLPLFVGETQNYYKKCNNTLCKLKLCCLPHFSIK